MEQQKVVGIRDARKFTPALLVEVLGVFNLKRDIRNLGVARGEVFEIPLVHLRQGKRLVHKRLFHESIRGWGLSRGRVHGGG